VPLCCAGTWQHSSLLILPPPRTERFRPRRGERRWRAANGFGRQGRARTKLPAATQANCLPAGWLRAARASDMPPADSSPLNGSACRLLAWALAALRRQGGAGLPSAFGARLLPAYRLNGMHAATLRLPYWHAALRRCNDYAGKTSATGRRQATVAVLRRGGLRYCWRAALSCSIMHAAAGERDGRPDIAHVPGFRTCVSWAVRVGWPSRISARQKNSAASHFSLLYLASLFPSKNGLPLRPFVCAVF